MPCDWSLTVSRSGQRVSAMRITEVLERRLQHLNFERPDRAIFGRLGVARGGKDAKPECQAQPPVCEASLMILLLRLGRTSPFVR